MPGYIVRVELGRDVYFCRLQSLLDTMPPESLSVTGHVTVVRTTVFRKYILNTVVRTKMSLSRKHDLT